CPELSYSAKRMVMSSPLAASTESTSLNWTEVTARTRVTVSGTRIGDLSFALITIDVWYTPTASSVADIESGRLPFAGNCTSVSVDCPPSVSDGFTCCAFGPAKGSTATEMVWLTPTVEATRNS